GGLAETIFDYDENNTSGNGFSFKEFSVSQFKRALERAIIVYKNKPGLWKELISRALNSDFSWRKPSRAYLELYELAIDRKTKEVL
ncbi:MAG: starch synthase, partial [Ruminiclostridium sp.]